MARLDSLQRVEMDSRAAWRTWLEVNHASPASIWLVTWKKGRGPSIGYDAIVEEALCFGWVDSLPRKLDADRSMLLLSPRRAGSNWSKVNKDRVERLARLGAMAPAGLAVVERAKTDGTWVALDAVEALTVPDDLAVALAAVPGAGAAFAAFPRSGRRGILEWVAAAKRAETRARRVSETARLASKGVMANFPAGRDRPGKRELSARMLPAKS